MACKDAVLKEDCTGKPRGACREQSGIQRFGEPAVAFETLS